MNKDQVIEAIKKYEDRVQKELVKLIGSNKQQTKSMSKQFAGKTEQKYSDTNKHYQIKSFDARVDNCGRYMWPFFTST